VYGLIVDDIRIAVRACSHKRIVGERNTQDMMELRDRTRELRVQSCAFSVLLKIARDHLFPVKIAQPTGKVIATEDFFVHAAPPVYLGGLRIPLLFRTPLCQQSV